MVMHLLINAGMAYCSVQIDNILASTESTDATVNAGHGNILLNTSEER